VIAFPNCKINLGLNILERRIDGFHNLETVFYPIVLQDGLEIVQSTLPETSITTSGLTIDADKEQNICFKAYQLLKKKFEDLPAVKIHLHKVIPSGAGLGGGSADGAFTLLLLNKKFNLGLKEDQLMNYALQLGSDCPFFIKNKPCYAKERGEILEEINLDFPAYKIVLINPGIHINTAWAFSKINPSKDRKSLKEIIQKPIDSWKEELTNDFEEPVFAEYPEIKKIKETLYYQGAIFSSLSGSGSTVYGLFQKEAALNFDFPSHYFIKLI
jgi:4-diphosphocytidyl-2-C-methyl-D-erythritol kinase